MKNSIHLQEKLFSLTRGRVGLYIGDLPPPWNDRDFFEKFWVVRDYVENSGDVTNEDPLQQWLEEYYFFISSKT